MLFLNTDMNPQSIDLDDLKLAIALNDTRTTGLDPHIRIVNDTCEHINSQPLPEISEGSVLLRLSRRPDYLQRSYTYVPGSEAYPEVGCFFVSHAYLFLNNASAASSTS